MEIDCAEAGQFWVPEGRLRLDLSGIIPNFTTQNSAVGTIFGFDSGSVAITVSCIGKGRRPISGRPS